MHSNDSVEPAPADPASLHELSVGDLGAFHTALESRGTVHEALHAICRLVEARLPGTVCAVTLASRDGLRIDRAVGPGLPPGYSAAIAGTPVAPGAGSSSHAIRTAKGTVAEDISTDPNWADWRELALAYSFQSCVSHPILDATGKPIGSFDIYQRGLRQPVATDLELARAASRIAALALERDGAGRTLAALRMRFAALAESVHAPFALIDARGLVSQTNAAFVSRFGGSSDDWQGRPLRQALGDAAYVALAARLEGAPDGGAVELDTGIPAAPLGREAVKLTASAWRGEDGALECVQLVVRPSAAAGAFGHAGTERVIQAIDAANLGYFEVSLAERTISISERCAAILGEHRGTGALTIAEYVARIHPEERDAAARRFVALLRGVAPDASVEHRLRHVRGDWVWARASVRVVEQDARGRPERLAGTLVDINEHRKSEQYIHQLAYHDPLTALPNRRMFQLSLERAVRRAQRDQRPVTLVAIGLDRFRRINDVAGHAAGDRVLQTIAQRLRRVVGSDEAVSRPGGDEFAVICDQGESLAVVAELARRLCDAVAEPTPVGGLELRITASAGISSYPEDAGDSADLIRNASIALQRAKSSGHGNTIRNYSSHMDALASRRLTLECQLRDAIARGEMALCYQPILDCARGGVVAVEALMRWRHPDHGTVLPERFFPIAEDAGLDDELGAWALMEACRQAKDWTLQGLPAVRIAVNVSSRHLSGAVVDHVARALSDTGWSPELLQLEISEAALGADPRHAARVLDRLKLLGVRLAIDDFGTAGSSLTALKHFPLDVLKIDRSFVNELGKNPADAALVDAIVTLSRALAFEVVAEGVETESQLQLLKEHGVDAWQGYLCVPAMPADRCAAWLSTRFAALRPGAVAPQPELV